MKHSLQGKVALLTGASSGIGRATALRLARSGVRLGLAARSADALTKVAAEVAALGSAALVLPTDVTDSAQCGQAVQRTVDHFGRLDIVVSSAGLSMRAYFDDSNLEALEQVLRVNFLGTVYIVHHALPHLKKTHGSIVGLSSLTGLRGVPSYAMYGASKFALQGLFDSLRLELKRDRVHVGLVAPGFVDTPLRFKVLGPDGKSWANPPLPPFRIWPVEKCVDRIMVVITRRRRQKNLPWFMGPLFWLDEIVFRSIGDAILRWKFPRV